MSEVTFSGNTIGDKALYLTGVERGKKQEQERIIKLLEDKGAHEWHDGHEELTCDTCHNIALIKGESQKDNETVVFLTEGENK
jgi:hypothetical protein